MSKQTKLRVRGATVRGKLDLQSNRLIEETLRITTRQKERVQAYRALHDGKKLSDAWRDVINAGLEKLGVPYVKEDPAPAAGPPARAA